ncbi:WD40-repeat-containing domain protein [Jimgerdemannia flammicorona]|uniref:WD40-repeat-containing domain protein n=1 Tax=Jimgerdemannia flammicorona TaxID=994334 RepID=A0A433QXZ6_9FUNG|nr:WD40-repeat-containing domain protein [Jimgerdemannia flammicorona]
MEVHRCRFVKYQPASINALSYTPRTAKPTLLACGRANGNIEIWNPQWEWNLDKTIPGGANMSVEALVFTHQTILTDEDDYDTEEEKVEARKNLLAAPPRLFSAGLNAYIMEWNLHTLQAQRSVDSHGGAIWCMAANHVNTVLAIGCEDGCVRLFDIADGELSFIRSFDKQKGRILSVAWSPDDKYIVTGSSDSSIRKWDVTQGRSIARMTVEKLRREDTLVWAVSVLASGTIVSGDSLGHVKFWDGKLGTMLQTFPAHGADVLCLVASRDGRTVFTSGVDRKLNQFHLVETSISSKKRKAPSNNSSASVPAPTSTTKWILAHNRRFHSHDVRALALEEDRPVNALVSGGIDVSLVVCPAQEFPDTTQRRLSCLPQKPVVSVSKTKRLMLCRFTNVVKVWRLGKASAPTQPYLDMDIGAHLDLVEPQQAVLEMTMKDDRNITASALSENGMWIAVAEVEETKLFKVEDDPNYPGRLIVRKQKQFASSIVTPSTRGFGAHYLLFTPDSSKLVIAMTNSQVLVVDLSGWQEQRYEILRRFGQHRGMGENDERNDDGDEQVSTIVSMTISADGQWLSTGDLLNRIHVFNLDALQYHTTLPNFAPTHTTLTFHSYHPSTLIVSLASNEFYLYDVELCRLTDWSRKYSEKLPIKFLQFKDKIMGFGFNPARPNTIVAWGVSYLCLIDLAKGVGDRDAVLNVAKRKRVEEDKAEVHKKVERRRRYEKLGITTPMPEPPRSAVGEEGEGVEDDGVNFQVLHKFQPLMFLDFVGPDSMVVVERPMFGILEKLPPSFYKAKYGT